MRATATELVTMSLQSFASSAAVPPRLLHPVHRCASTIRRGCLRNHRPQRSCNGKGQIRFLKAIFATAHSLLQVLHHGSSASSSDVCRGSSPSMRTPSNQSSSPSDHRHEGTVSHKRFLLSNYVLHINMLICVGIIFLDNLL
jgi:hypothetical protein